MPLCKAPVFLSTAVLKKNKIWPCNQIYRRNFMKNEYTVTKKMYQSWLTESGFHGKGLALCISFCSLAVLSVLMVLTHPFEAYSIFYIGAFICCIYMAFFKNAVTAAQQYKSIVSIVDGGEWKRSISFEDSVIRVDDGFGDDSAMEIPYSKILSAKEKESTVTLCLFGGGIVCLYKDCFNGGDWQQCKTFLLEKNPKIKIK